jgi:hypothetical protein
MVKATILTEVDQVVWNEFTVLQGSTALVLPTAFDGDDLEVHLVHTLSPPTEPDEVEDIPLPADPKERTIPAPGAGLALLAFAAAARHRGLNP